MNIIQNIWGKFQDVIELVLTNLEQGSDYLSFQRDLKEILNGLGQDIVKEYLEAADADLLANREKREGWQLERRNETKNILTVFGQVSYQRSYFKNASTGKYSHLVDELAGYGPHARVDPLLKAHVVDLACELSYKKSGQIPVEDARDAVLSAQAVMQSIRSFDPGAAETEKQAARTKGECAHLFIEADEDHVSGQGRENFQPRLVYIHEGSERISKNRRRLKNPHYIAGIFDDPDDLWFKVLDYIEDHYDTGRLQKIFVCGDGASWIRHALEIIPNTCFVLDYFHLERYLVSAFGRNTPLHRQAWEEIASGDQTGLERVFFRRSTQEMTKNERETLTDCLRYIRNNWDGILTRRQFAHLRLGVSAEGHVSHILSARLSSRPLAWGRTGVDQMARLRALKANRVSIKESYLKQCRPRVELFKLCAEQLNQERQKLKKAVGEVTRNMNIPAMSGPITQLRRVLKALSADFPITDI